MPKNKYDLWLSSIETRIEKMKRVSRKSFGRYDLPEELFDSSLKDLQEAIKVMKQHDKQQIDLKASRLSVTF